MVMGPEVRWRLLGLGLGLAAPLLFSCPGYSPTLTDCSVHCGPQQSCPSGYQCKANWCRPLTASGACDCKPGDQRACGGGKGVCVAGVQTCSTSGTWGLCVGEGKPTAELCDGLDNDCDGTVDNDVSDAPVCPLQAGVCAGRVQICTNGAFQGYCDATTYGPDYEPVEQKCDGLDNDCDGVVDGTAGVPILASVVEYDLHELDSGYLVAASVLDEDAGNYGMRIVQLNDRLQKLGPPITVPNGTAANNQYVRATSYGGVAYVTFAEQTQDSDVHLIAVDPDGGIREFPTVSPSGLNGSLSVGVDGTLASVAYLADGGTIARMINWPLDGGPYQVTSLSGPPNSELDVYSAAVSPHRVATVWTGYDLDAGADVNVSQQLNGTKTGAPPLFGGYRLDDTGSTVHASWYEFDDGQGICIFFICVPGEKYSAALYKQDLFSTAYATTLRKVGDNTVIQATNIGRGPGGAAVVWTEYGTRVVVAVPIGNGAQARMSYVYPDAGIAGDPDVAYNGVGGMMAVTYLDGTGYGNLYGQMTCPP
jgi:hypothetical protein